MEIIKRIKEWKKRRRSFISVETARRNRDILQRSYTYDKRTLNILLGSVSVGVGIITLPIPTGSLFLILFGLGLVACPLSISSLLGGLYRSLYERWLLW